MYVHSINSESEQLINVNTRAGTFDWNNDQALKGKWIDFVAVTGLEPDFVYPLENLTISQGRDATFTCVVSNLGGYRVSPSSSASGDHSGGAKARVTILPLTCVRL